MKKNTTFHTLFGHLRICVFIYSVITVVEDAVVRLDLLFSLPVIIAYKSVLKNGDNFKTIIVL